MCREGEARFEARQAAAAVVLQLSRDMERAQAEAPHPLAAREHNVVECDAALDAAL